MRIIKPYFEIVGAIDGVQMLRKIESIGRTCYKSEDRIDEESHKKFVAFILKLGHESVIEHESVTVRIVCDRGITHELVRHRLASYSQESTRYCNYKGGVTFIKPPWVDLCKEFVVGKDYIPYDLGSSGTFLSIDDDDCKIPKVALSTSAAYWLQGIIQSERAYLNLLKYDWSPQQARAVLPNSLKTEIVMTCNLREWRHFFKLRTAKAAHPQMREITIPMLQEFKNLIPIIFDDIDGYQED